MSIRNATIARRRRKIGLSEQERVMLATALRPRSGRSGHKQPDKGLPLEKTNKAPNWHTNWAEW